MDMKKPLAWALAALFLSSTAMAAPSAKSSQNKSEFCSANKNRVNYQKDMAYDESNLMAFTNHGGLVNGGVCWWHSRFQRNALYLTIYSPKKTKPTVAQAQRIVKDIRAGSKVIEIPGFKNFNDFSRENYSLIQAELEAWQRTDGFVRQSWIVGLSGSHQVSAVEMRKRMDELYDYVVGEKKIAYNKLQIKGITAHAWLVVDMRRDHNGYELDIIDSNYGYVQTYKYTQGMQSFYHGYYGDFVPYLEQTREQTKLEKTVTQFCK
jgi:hypothetical protein